MVVFLAKKLMERWYLLITEKFLFWTFWKWKTRSFCKPKSWWKDDIYWLLKSSRFELFGDRKYGLFLSQKVDGKLIFTDYWKFDRKIVFIDYLKFILLNFSEIRNTVFFWAQKLMEILYLLITEKFLFWTFQRWEIRSFSEPKSWWKDDIY